MKVFIWGGALIVILALFNVYQVDNTKYLQYQDRYKAVANDAADAASLYYNMEQFSDGVKVFNKGDGNAAIEDVIDSALKASPFLKEEITYYIYYFDGDGKMTSYQGNSLISENINMEFPYRFKEVLTGYEKTLNEASVIVTIDAGKFDYRLSFINDPDLIRISGYEYQQNQ